MIIKWVKNYIRMALIAYTWKMVKQAIKKKSNTRNNKSLTSND